MKTWIYILLIILILDCEASPWKNTRRREKRSEIVQGQWSSWTYSGQCTTTCGGGNQTQTRQCNARSGTVRWGVAFQCDGEAYRKISCNNQACPEWSEWSFIGGCSRGCLKRAFRVCKGNACEGVRYKTEHCNTPPCPGGGGSEGHWSSWSEWGQCSKTCGRGLQERRRQCSRGNGRCNGQSLGSRSCFVKECPVDGQWSAWVNHSNCSEPCGGLGKRDQIRFCNNPAPENGGRDCEGDHIRLIHCNLQACKVDGQWSAWINIEECSETCGGGRQRQTRACTNPAPENGGKQCTGETSRVIDCNSQPCKGLSEDCEARRYERLWNKWHKRDRGNWSRWTNGECSALCGGGVRTQTRRCISGRRGYGGYDEGDEKPQCNGASSRTRPCNNQPCSGQWSAWSNSGQCSITCGGGVQRQTRECKADNGGYTNWRSWFDEVQCSGESSRTIECNNQACQDIIGTWSDWINLGSCTRKCGEGVQYQFRRCTNGAKCLGKKFKTIPCNIQPCTVNLDGQWSAWMNVGSCSKTCGRGAQKLERSCTNPTPRNAGRGCSGDSTRSIDCNSQPCEVDGQWSAWINGGSCSKTCGGGKQKQERSCTNPTPQNGGRGCSGDLTRSIDCNSQPCKVDGQWSAWKNDGTCSKTCGRGKQKQERSCTNPSPQNGGRGCIGDSTRSIDCNPKPCKVDGQWSAWINVGSCSKTCGGGTQKQERSCTNPTPRNGGRGCSGDSTRSIDCNSQPCKVDGQWSDWVNDGSCSKTCGGGEQKQERSCTNPAPRNAGRSCRGDSTRSIDCNSQPCPVDGQWSAWVNDGRCSKTCGGGKQKQERSCTNPPPQNAGRGCSGDSIRSIDCNSQPCKELPSGACQKRTENAGCVVTIFYSGICKQTAPKFAPCPYEAYIYEDEGNSSQATIRINGTSTVLKEGQSYEKCATFSLTNFTLSVKESFCNLFELENLIG